LATCLTLPFCLAAFLELSAKHPLLCPLFDRSSVAVRKLHFSCNDAISTAVADTNTRASGGFVPVTATPDDLRWLWKTRSGKHKPWRALDDPAHPAAILNQDGRGSTAQKLSKKILWLVQYEAWDWRSCSESTSGPHPLLAIQEGCWPLFRVSLGGFSARHYLGVATLGPSEDFSQMVLLLIWGLYHRNIRLDCLYKEQSKSPGLPALEVAQW
jgi:hypothetical protein